MNSESGPERRRAAPIPGGQRAVSSRKYCALPSKAEQGGAMAGQHRLGAGNQVSGEGGHHLRAAAYLGLEGA